MIHIINLKHRVDRRNQVLEELEGQKMTNYVFWEGCYDLQKPSRGIARAHQQVVVWAASHNLPSVLIAEDDVQFTAPGALDYFLNKEPTDYDLYLGGISYGRIRYDQTVDAFAGTHLYKISNRFYKTFLSLTGENDFDRDLIRKGRYYVCHPMVAVQRNGFSDNKKEYRNNELYFENRELWKG